MSAAEGAPQPEQGQQEPQGRLPGPSAAQLISVVDAAFAAADARRSRLGPGVLDAEGMSGAKTRHLYNNLCSFAGCRCLQVGVWKGSSVFAALSGNPGCAVTAIDNWSEFNGASARREFAAAAEALLSADERLRLTVIDGDAFDLSPPLPDGAFNVYVYDGAHDYESQVYALTALWRHLAAAAIVVIDDWNFDLVRQGTSDALSMLGGSCGGRGVVARAWQLRLTAGGRHTPLAEAAEGYWNGVGVFVIDKAAAAAPDDPP